ncbi:MAG: vWA domain-containing protein [Bradymonadia bacterium]
MAHATLKALMPLALATLTACGAMDDDAYDSGDQGGAYYPPAPNNGYVPPQETPPSGDPQSGEQYEHYGHNPFVDAEEDNLATFAIDVDTASYTLTRRNINNGWLPDPASIRVEEFINYFKYADEGPAPSDARPFAIHMEVAPSLFGDSAGGQAADDVERSLMRVNIRGIDLENEERKSANLVFLLDVSGSMSSPDKLGLVQYSMRRLTETLRPDDTISIVVYAGADGVVLPPTPVSNAGRIIDAVESLRPGGGTNGEAGIRTAYRLAQEAYKNDGINRVILCTDGDFNVGLTGDALVGLIEEKRDEGVTLTVLGFGSGNYNDRTMEQLANKGNGNYAYIDQIAEAERVLVEGITGTLQVIAKDVKIQVELNSDAVARYRLIGYENRDIADDQFRDDAVDAGEIGAGHQVTAYLELELQPNVRADATLDLATVRVRYKAPDATADDAALEEVARTLEMGAHRRDFEDASDDFQFGAAVVEFAEVLRESPHSVGRRLGELQSVARRAAGDDARRAEFIELVERAATLTR